VAKLLKHVLKGDVLIVYLEGRLDVSIANEVEENLAALIDNGNHRKVLLNMEGIEYMSSSGFRACISTLRKLNAKEGALKMCNIKPAVKRIFDVIELTSLFDIYPSEQEALTSF
jgi:stage II sporulation protein AA (anti-sigma F factor antagonist)